MSTIKINPWFGQLPDKWQQGQLKRFYSVRLGKMLQPNQLISSDKLVPYMRAANISWAGPDVSDIKQMWASPKEIINNKLEPGDLLISEGGDVGRSCLWNDEIQFCIFQNAINRIRPRQLNSTKFLYYLMQVVKNSGWIDIICNKATIAHFTAEKVNALEIPIPNHAEQRCIAAYLDEQTAKIDRLMDLRQRQIALLKEQRAALIQQAVTRGLNPNAPMKDSGLPWLGEIPAHWSIIPLGRLAIQLQTGPFGSQLHAHEYVEGGIPVINPSHLAEGLIQHDPTCSVDESTARKLDRHFLQVGDIVFARRGELGRCALVRSEEVGWLCGTGSLLMRPDTQILVPAYLVKLFELKRLKESLTLQSVGSTMDNLNTGILSRMRLPLPLLDEQVEILCFIEKQTEKFDVLHFAYSHQLTLLAEYRAALIHECVTGQRIVPDHYSIPAGG
ncbi:MAG: restriction endonuclease subunit S [Candidatus Contendobacter sp.]